MRLTTFAVQTVLGRFERLGALLGDRLIDLNACQAWRLHEAGEEPDRAKALAALLLPADMLGFLDAGAAAMAEARAALAWVAQAQSRAGAWPLGLDGATLAFAEAAVQRLAPLPRPRALRDYYAFEEHVATGFKKRNEPIPEAWYRLPVSYKGNPRTVLGPNQVGPWPDYTELMDFELELAIVVGKKGLDLRPEEAMAHVAGLMVMNDLSARDVQRLEMACRLGPAKGKDFATVLGPELVTLDEIPNLEDLPCEVRVNGELWSSSNAGKPFWHLADLVAHASRGEAIHPGDVLATGTVGRGCGLELDRYPQAGDTMALSIQGLGTLVTPLGHPPQPHRPLGERLAQV